MEYSIGGTIGTVLFVQIGRGLLNGGPGSLFTAFSLWCFVVLAITVSMAEMVTYLPISSPFIRFAGRYVDEALGFATGWNFFIFEAILVPFEMTACNVIIHYWSDAVPAGGIIAIVLVLYGAINVMGVKWYGEAEFWSALGKIVLIVGLIFYTLVTMLGMLFVRVSCVPELMQVYRRQPVGRQVRIPILEQPRVVRRAVSRRGARSFPWFLAMLDFGVFQHCRS